MSSQYQLNGFSRRDAIGLLGKGILTGAIGMAFTGRVSAQTLSLSFVVRDYILYIQPNPQYSWSARLIVRNAPYQCSLIFIRPDLAIPQNSVASNGLSGNFYLPESMLEPVMGLIRSQSPLRVTISSSLIGTIANDEDEAPGQP